MIRIMLTEAYKLSEVNRKLVDMYQALCEEEKLNSLPREMGNLISDRSFFILNLNRQKKFLGTIYKIVVGICIGFTILTFIWIGVT